MKGTLPFGLQIYAPGEFEAIHAAGSGIMTTSSIPAIFGYSKWTGKYALSAHLAGKFPLPSGDNPLKTRGHDLEPITRKKLRAEGYRILSPAAGMFARHPTIPNFLGSPDSVLWQPKKPELGQILHEGKVVARSVFSKEWNDGPPTEHQLQQAGHFACCPGAERGVITALVIGEFTLDLHIYETERNNEAIAIIEDAVRALLDILAHGELPPPDTHESAKAVLQALHPLDETKEIMLIAQDYVEGVRQADSWRDAAKARLIAEKIEKDAKAWFLAKAKGAGRVHIGNDRMVVIKEQYRAEYSVPAGKRQTITLKESNG